MRLPLVMLVALQLCGQSGPPAAEPASILDDIPRAAEGAPLGGAGPTGILPAPRPSEALVVPSRREGVDWSGLLQASGRFLALEHGFRLLTEAGTRSGLTGAYFGNYGSAIGNLHGWADGDEFYVNYVGHPMGGSVAGFLWVLNDRDYRRAEFGRDRLYWKSRLRAAAFAWAYSEQFEIGPFSEASIGAIQSYFPQQGFVDHVVTPAIGMAWMIGEDAVDKYLIERIEAATKNRYIRLLSRSTLNPTRSLANVLQGKPPWNRETRAGVLAYAPSERKRTVTRKAERFMSEAHDVAGPAPFELAITFQAARFLGEGRTSCLGGGADAAFRISESWQLVADIGGCKIAGLDENLSGDSLTYMAGPRFRTRDQGRWSANVQVLIGGNKLTEERLFPRVKKLLETASARDPRLQVPTHSDYTEEAASNGVAVRGGGGIAYKLNGALTLQVAELAYQHSWARPLWGRSYSDSLRVSSGLVLRMGTW